ncbi:MAG: glycosyltransferase family 39 protein [Anaerolineales bacterium]
MISSTTPKEQGFNSDRRHLIILFAILVLAFVLRILYLDQKGLWADEIFTAIFAAPENSLSVVIERSLATPIPTPPLWFILTNLFQRFIGEGTIQLRLLAVIFGTLGVSAMYKFGQIYFNRTIGYVGALLMAVSPLHIYFSREARFYAAVTFFSILTFIYLQLGLENNRKKWWGLFALATLLNLYTHLTALFVLATEVAFVVFSVVKESTLIRGNQLARVKTKIDFPQFTRPFLLSLIAICVLYLPMIPSIAQGIAGERGLGSSVETEGFRLSFEALFGLLAAFSGGQGVILAFFLSLAVLGAYTTMRTKGHSLIFFFINFLVPVLAILVLKPKHWFAYKYVIFLLPIFLLCVSTGVEYLANGLIPILERIRGFRNSRAFVGALMIILCIPVGFNFAAVPEAWAQQNDRWEIASEIIFRNIESNDAVAVLPVDILTFQADELIGYSVNLPPDVSLQRVDSIEMLEELLNRSERLWVVVAPASEQDNRQDFMAWVSLQPNVIIEARDIRIFVLSKDATNQELLEAAMAFDLRNAEAYGALAHGFVSIGELERALEAYDKAIQLAPNEGNWHLASASIHERLGNETAARQGYLDAMAVEPSQPGYIAAYADFLRRIGDLEGGIRYYQLAIDAWNRAFPGVDTSGFVAAWQRQIEILSATLSVDKQ